MQAMDVPRKIQANKMDPWEEQLRNQRFFTVGDIAELFREHRTTVWRKVKARVYPAPIYVVPGKPLWPRDEIQFLIDKAHENRRAT